MTSSEDIRYYNYHGSLPIIISRIIFNLLFSFLGSGVNGAFPCVFLQCIAAWTGIAVLFLRRGPIHGHSCATFSRPSHLINGGYKNSHPRF